jgi:hypothetical protein
MLVAVLRWLSAKLVTLLAILVVLVVLGWVRAEWAKLAKMEERVASKQRLMAELDNDLRRIDSGIAARAEEFRKRLEELGSMEANVRRLRGVADEAGAERRRLEGELWPWDRILRPKKAADVEVAKAKHEAALKAADLAEEVWKRARAMQGSPESEFAEERSRKEAARRELAAQMQEDAAALQQQPIGRLKAAVRTHLPVALGLLLAVALAPVAIRAALYFGAAPFAAKLPPVRLVTVPGPAVEPVVQPAAPTLEIPLAPGEELLVHPDCVHRSSKLSSKRTEWFLNRRLPFSSFAAGMYALIRVAPSGLAGSSARVNARGDGAQEVGWVRLPAGAALVLQPRALVGVVKPGGGPVEITKHWRLGSLQAWLTLQLRFLVFHGPCTLILQGGRGFSAERPSAADSARVNQASVIGFSAHLAYGCVRAEAFVPYLRGKQALFDDWFAGEGGIYLTEQKSEAGSGRRGLGRGIEGVVDAALKAFGI